VDCVQTAMPDLSGARLHVPIELVAGSEPFELGDEFTTAGGTTYQASALSFFLSHAFLIDAEGGRVPALFSDPDGVPRPYDLLLVNADALEPLSLDLLAPVAAYESLELGVGVPPECNHIDPTRSVFPLNASSGLHWDWAQGYMFIRVEGSVKSGEDWASFSYHVGFDEVYRVVTLVGDLNTLSDRGARLIVDVNRLLEGTTSTSGGVHLMPVPEFADHFATSGVLDLAPPAP